MGRSPCCSKEGLNRGAWTVVEDKILTEYIKVHGEGRWRSVPKKSGFCFFFLLFLNLGKKKQKKFKKKKKRCGFLRNFHKVAGLKRCGKSCRLRWLNYLRPDIKRGNISIDEEDLIVRLHKLLGNRFFF